MSKDYKGSGARPREKNSAGGSLLVGILIGLVLGLGIALGVAWYLYKSPTPFIGRGVAGKEEKSKTGGPDAARSDEKSAKTGDGKPRFDFYKILPGSEEPVTDQQLKDAQQRSSTAQAKEAFFLQVGSFQNAPDADNLKAKLALLGVESVIQTTSLPDKGIWHRVRVGPYTAIDDLNRVRDNLKQNGLETTLIKVRENPDTVAK